MLPMQHRMELPQRRILPQNVQMQTINMSPLDMMPRENQKNYVFVDEHNRHKRLKVMRACEGCRRRKIKCDAATTNTWPCSACVRLKLHCVPPTVQYDRNFSNGQSDTGEDFDGPSSSEDDYPGSNNMHTIMPPGAQLRKSTSTGTLPHYIGKPTQGLMHIHTSQGVQDFIPIQYPTLDPSVELDSPIPFSATNMYSSPQLGHNEVSQNWTLPHDNSPGGFNTKTVREVLGQLKIEDEGVASYIGSQGRDLARAPAYDDPWDQFESHPVFIPGQHDYAVRIRPEDMPSDTEAESLFEIFFQDVQPYLPIVNKAAFYRQWHTNRHSISPLLLESIFACAGRISSNPRVGLRWLNMASKHLDCFFDVPRLSTVQALIILLKARESAPQRGYFFRSYMSIVTMMAMARDLNLDKHADLHKSEGVCTDNVADCMLKSRIWQCCFIMELLVCPPQGRNVLSSDPSAIDLDQAAHLPDMDSSELRICEDFTQFLGLVKKVRHMNDTFSRLRSQSPTWAGDPEFLALGPTFDEWFFELPPHLQIEVPLDLTMPMPIFKSHYAANLNVYGHLARVMFHRPALAFAKATSPTTNHWKIHLHGCYDSSRRACRLAEAVFEQYGIRGLQCMARGVNFYIYAILTTTMVNLVAATCPDPEFNADAREYFTRSMRIMERCIDISASSETKGQIEALRVAFSQDVTQPFVLNANFPFYTSPSNPHLSPPASSSGYSPGPNTHSPHMSGGHLSYTGGDTSLTGSHSLSPPHPGSHSDKGEPTSAMSLTSGSIRHHRQAAPAAEQVGNVWNPQALFDHWNTGFPGTTSLPLPSSTLAPVPELSAVSGMGTGYVPAPNQHVIVSPDAWQNTVAQIYSGAKRSWQYANQ